MPLHTPPAIIAQAQVDPCLIQGGCANASDRRAWSSPAPASLGDIESHAMTLTAGFDTFLKGNVDLYCPHGIKPDESYAAFNRNHTVLTVHIYCKQGGAHIITVRSGP